MAIESNKHGIIPEYKPDEYLGKFIPLVLKEANEYTEFSVFDLGKKLNLSEKDNLIFNDLTFKVRVHLIDNGIANMCGSHMVKLTEKGRDIKNGKEKIFGITINDFKGSTIGTYIQDSYLKKSPIKNKIKAPPINNPATKSSLKKFFSNPWTIGIGLIIIEEIFVGYFRGFLNL